MMKTAVMIMVMVTWTVFLFIYVINRTGMREVVTVTALDDNVAGPPLITIDKARDWVSILAQLMAGVVVPAWSIYQSRRCKR